MVANEPNVDRCKARKGTLGIWVAGGLLGEASWGLGPSGDKSLKPRP